ncbi:MAG: metallophosphoesterase family protein [Deltaproteobacteria bacterium]|nr:metallophosphoesterase family protein [Deltaproteobacteria bacterium]
MRIAVFSDVHADQESLELALGRIQAMSCDVTICLGDVVDSGSNPNEVVRLLRDRQIPTIRGNHDRWAAKERSSALSEDVREWLTRLPTHWRMSAEGLTLAAWHARPGSDMNGIPRGFATPDLQIVARRSGADVLFVGHTHEPFCRRVIGGWMVANPGSLLRVNNPAGVPTSATFATLDLPSLRFKVFRVVDGSEVDLH